MKDPINVYLIVDKRFGKPVKRLYLTEKNAIKEFQGYNQNVYSLCKYSVIAVLKDDEWVNIEDLK